MPEAQKIFYHCQRAIPNIYTLYEVDESFISPTLAILLIILSGKTIGRNGKAISANPQIFPHTNVTNRPAVIMKPIQHPRENVNIRVANIMPAMAIYTSLASFFWLLPN